MQWVPDVEDVIEIHEQLVKLFESEDDPISPPGIRSQDLLESACSRPLTAIGNTEKYQSIDQKAAALFHSLTKNHAFHNGNKRTAVVTLLTLLHRNDRLVSMSVTDNTLYDFVLAVTSDEFPTPNHGLTSDQVVEHIANWIKSNTQTSRLKLGSMKTSEFKKKCSMAGAQVKDADGGSFVVSFKDRSVRLSRSTKQLSGPVVMRYLRHLRLNETSSGVAITEFQQGVSEEREQIHRFMATLKRLAKT